MLTEQVASHCLRQWVTAPQNARQLRYWPARSWRSAAVPLRSRSVRRRQPARAGQCALVLQLICCLPAHSVAEAHALLRNVLTMPEVNTHCMIMSQRWQGPSVIMSPLMQRCGYRTRPRVKSSTCQAQAVLLAGRGVRCFRS